jgi:hypothetical protein
LNETTLLPCIGEYKLDNQPGIKIGLAIGSLFSQFDGSSFRNYLVPLGDNTFEMREEFSTDTSKLPGRFVKD